MKIAIKRSNLTRVVMFMRRQVNKLTTSQIVGVTTGIAQRRFGVRWFEEESFSTAEVVCR